MTDNPALAPATTLPLLADLGLSSALVDAAAAAGWRQATPIQALMLPAVLQGRDVLALAPTGSGKTAAFLLPLLQRALAADLTERPCRLRVLVLTPTRELALQTGALATRLAPQLRVRTLVGGVSPNPQMMALRGGAHLVVCTPGRLLDLQARGALRLDAVAALVLDEADRLLDLGFADELQRVLALLPAQRQNLLLSATLPAAVAVLAQQQLKDPLTLDLRLSATLPSTQGDAAAAPPTRQRALSVDAARRTPLLRHLIALHGWRRVLVFVASRHAAEQVADKLRQAGLPAAALHGQLSPGRRAQVLADLGSGLLDVLVATDLAARGLDLPDVQAVVNHDLPRSATDYTHRTGRTGRLGHGDTPGQALSFICADQAGSEALFRLIEKRQRQRVPRETVPGFEPASPVSHTAPAPAAAPGQPGDPAGGVKGLRKSRKDRLREQAAAAQAAPRPSRPGA